VLRDKFESLRADASDQVFKCCSYHLCCFFLAIPLVLSLHSSGECDPTSMVHKVVPWSVFCCATKTMAFCWNEGRTRPVGVQGAFVCRHCTLVNNFSVTVVKEGSPWNSCLSFLLSPYGPIGKEPRWASPPRQYVRLSRHLSTELVSMPTSAATASGPSWCPCPHQRCHLTKTANKNRAPACVRPSTAAGTTDISVGCAISLSARYLLHLHVYDMCLFRSCW
jgi:hypothetical protein